MTKKDAYLSYLKIKIEIAREKLNQAWDSQGKTDPAVLTAGEEFDALLNQYQRRANALSSPSPDGR